MTPGRDVERRTFSESRRMRSVQAPVIPILERWIAETPGTISLGQGVVSFGPLPGALEAARRFGAQPADHRYGPNESIPALVAAVEEKLARENGIVVRPSSRVFVTAGGNVPCDVPDSQGAFYHFLRLPSDLDPMVLAERLIREHRVAVIPGSALGQTRGCSGRVSYGAFDQSTLAEGLKRHARGLQAIL